MISDYCGTLWFLLCPLHSYLRVTRSRSDGENCMWMVTYRTNLSPPKMPNTNLVPSWSPLIVSWYLVIIATTVWMDTSGASFRHRTWLAGLYLFTGHHGELVTRECSEYHHNVYRIVMNYDIAQLGIAWYDHRARKMWITFMNQSNLPREDVFMSSHYMSFVIVLHQQYCNALEQF